MPGKNSEDQLAALLRITTNAVDGQLRTESKLDKIMRAMGVIEAENRVSFSNEFTFGYTLFTILGPTDIIPYSASFTNKFKLDWKTASLYIAPNGTRLNLPTILTSNGGAIALAQVNLPSEMRAQAVAVIDSHSSSINYRNLGTLQAGGDTIVTVRWVSDDKLGTVLLLGFKPNTQN